jgi:hypothetical protein
MVHSERIATGLCHECGKDFCGECLVEIGNTRLCKDCVASTAPRAGAGASYGSAIKFELREKKVFNKFLLFIMGALPGLGYMYVGLLKRGLFTMAAFSATIYLIATVSGWFAFPLAAIVFASFFDGFRLLRQAREGMALQDGIEDLLAFLKKHKVAILGVVVGIIALELLGNVVRNLSSVTPFILIALGAYFLFFKKRKA